MAPIRELVRNTSSARSSSSGMIGRSTAPVNPITAWRMTPGSRPQETGGVTTSPPMTAKILETAPSATSPRVLRNNGSSTARPRARRFSMMFSAYASVFMRAKGEDSFLRTSAKSQRKTRFAPGAAYGLRLNETTRLRSVTVSLRAESSDAPSPAHARRTIVSRSARRASMPRYRNVSPKRVRWSSRNTGAPPDTAMVSKAPMPKKNPSSASTRARSSGPITHSPIGPPPSRLALPSIRLSAMATAGAPPTRRPSGDSVRHDRTDA